MKRTIGIIVVGGLCGTVGFLFGTAQRDARHTEHGSVLSVTEHRAPQVTPPHVPLQTPPADTTSPSDQLMDLQSMPDSYERNAALKQFFAKWAEIDPEEALLAADQYPRAQFLDLRDEIVFAWAKKSPEKALDFWATLPNSSSRFALLERISTDLAARSVGEALSFYAEVQHPMVRDILRDKIACELARSDPEAGLKWITETLHGDARNQALSSMATTLARVDAAQATDFIAALPQNTFRADMECMLVNEWSMYDPCRALEWVDKQASGAQHDQLLQISTHAIAYNLPEFAAAHLAEMAPSMQSEIASIVGETLATKDPKAAFAWVETVEDPELRLQALSSAVNAWASADAFGALEYALASEDVDARESMLRFIIDPMSDENPEMAARQLERLPEGEIRDDAFVAIAEEWFNVDPAEAEEWLLKQPDGAAFNAAVASVAAGMVGRDPVYALEWVNTIPEIESRQDALTAVMSDLLSRGTQYALSAVEQSGLPEAEKQQLRSQVITLNGQYSDDQ